MRNNEGKSGGGKRLGSTGKGFGRPVTINSNHSIIQKVDAFINFQEEHEAGN